jgi:hypothetical protein
MRDEHRIKSIHGRGGNQEKGFKERFKKVYAYIKELYGIA